MVGKAFVDVAIVDDGLWQGWCEGGVVAWCWFCKLEVVWSHAPWEGGLPQPSGWRQPPVVGVSWPVRTGDLQRNTTTRIATGIA